MTHPPTFTESIVEQAALGWLQALGFGLLAGAETVPEGQSSLLRESGVPYLVGPPVGSGMAGAERANYGEVVLRGRLWAALRRLNPALPDAALQEAMRKVLMPESPALIANNRAFHRMLVEGVPVEYQRPDGSIGGAPVRLVDFDDPERNDWLAVNQFTVDRGRPQPPSRRRRLRQRSAARGHRTQERRRRERHDLGSLQPTPDLQSSRFPSLFVYNELLVISDGVEARVGTLTADQERFMPWRTIDGETPGPAVAAATRGARARRLRPRRLLDSSGTSSSSRTTAPARRSRSSPAITSSTPSTGRRRPPSPPQHRTATAAAASSGTRRAPARA